LHQQVRTITEVLIDCRKPILAIINGPAVAGGFEVALSCDLRVAGDTAHFGLPRAPRSLGAHHASVGLPAIVHAATSLALLPRGVPCGSARGWLVTGRNIPAAEAERWGLLNRLAPADKLMDVAMELAGEVVKSAPISLQRMKLTYRKARGLPLHAGLRLDVGP